jgi:cell division protein FtsI (penicillin-binding protein 3)
MSNIRRKKLGKFDGDRQLPTRRPNYHSIFGRSLNFNHPNVRLAGVWIVLALGLGGLLLRLLWLQMIDTGNLTQKARSQQLVTIRPFVPRRTIVDRSNNQIAIDRPSYTMFAHPAQFSEIIFDKGKSKKGRRSKVALIDMAQRLAPILGRDPEQLLTELQKKKTGIKIGSGLREDTINRIRALKLDGLEISQGENDYTRFYPQENMLAEVLGSLDWQHQGQAGIERSQSSILERKVSQYALTKEARGDILPDRVTSDFLHTDDLKLRLSIDLKLQRAARTALVQQMKAWDAKRGTVIVMEADTGALRSMVVEPTYDPNNVSRDVENYAKVVGAKSAATLLQNWAVSEPSETGSTFKPINIAIALENGVIKPTTIINDPGVIVVHPTAKPIRNSHLEKYGDIDIATVLQVSSNVAMVKIMQRLKPNIYYNWLQRIGLGQKYGIDLPEEGQGIMHKRREFLSSPLYPANTAFGQGFTLTPMQLVTLMGSIANGGKLVTPHVVEGLFDSTGVRKDKPTLPEPSQIFSPANAQAVLEMMETVVTNKKGSGKTAQIPGYRIAGKTGTAQQARNGGYGDNRQKITSFVGILPVDSKRRYVVFAAIDRPKGLEKALGSTVAAPVVKSVMESLISIDGIPPSNPSQVVKEPKVK